MSTSQILNGLEKVRKVGNGRYVASCPLHTDKTPSLSVSIDQHGKVLMRCFSCGSNGADICGALGIEISSLFPLSDNPKYEKQARSGFSAWQLFNCMQDDLIRLVVITNILKANEALPEDDRKFVADLAVKISEGLGYLEGARQ